MPRRLDADEETLWARVTATVRPLRRRLPQHSETAPKPEPVAPKAARAASPSPEAKPPARHRPATANTLDGSWDRRLSAGRISPDVTIDLHGHTLASAHGLLEERLARAVADGDRVMLVITGRPPRPQQDPARPRGLIRQQLPHWLASSPNRGAIAAVRNAHPRHGGAGALYLILRRPRDGRDS